jgi:hypothetical protein
MLPIIISILSFLVAATAFMVVLWDRRPHLTIRSRKGEWYVLKSTGKGIEFAGAVEIYNVSSRANAIRGYEFWRKCDGDKWEKMESELYDVLKNAGEPSQIHNQTPLALAPYSGVEAKVLAYTRMPQRPYTLIVRVEVEDLFGKRYRIEVEAKFA